MIPETTIFLINKSVAEVETPKVFSIIFFNPLTAVLFTSFESHDIILLSEECRVPATVDARTPE